MNLIIRIQKKAREDATNEWVELYNTGSADINLQGWRYNGAQALFKSVHH